MLITKPVIAVLGRKSSGKTSIIKHIVEVLKRRGLRVATAKHIPKDEFTIDREGSDTWNHMGAGADLVMSVSGGELAVILRLTGVDLSLDHILTNALDCDALILEGFSTLVSDRSDVGKIVCIRDMEEYNFYKKSVSDIISFCTLKEDLTVPKILEDSSLISKDILRYVEERMGVLKVFNDLPKIDCKKCGFNSCLEMAEAIYRGKSKMEDCSILKAEPALKTSLRVAGEYVPLQHFVSEIVRGTVLGMASKLKGVKIDGGEEVHIEVLKKAASAR